MRTILIILAFLSLVASCSDEPLSKLEREVQSLSTIELQTKFLEDIHGLTIQSWSVTRDASNEKGRKSKEYEEALNFKHEAGIENLKKIDLFLKYYGHPHRDTHGDSATQALFAVIQSQYNYQPNEEQFPMFYKAYKIKDTHGAALAFYLNRLYMKKIGGRIDYGSRFTEEFEIDTLIKALNLLTEVEEVERQLQGVAD